MGRLRRQAINPTPPEGGIRLVGMAPWGQRNSPVPRHNRQNRPEIKRPTECNPTTGEEKSPRGPLNRMALSSHFIFFFLCSQGRLLNLHKRSLAFIYFRNQMNPNLRPLFWLHLRHGTFSWLWSEKRKRIKSYGNVIYWPLTSRVSGFQKAGCSCVIR